MVRSTWPATCSNGWQTGTVETTTASSTAENPQGPKSGDYRVLRGGSFYLIEDNARCASRYNLDAVNRLVNVGFRVSASPGLLAGS